MPDPALGEGWSWVRFRGRVTRRDAAGRALRAAGAVVDISERKASEAALQQERAGQKRWSTPCPTWSG